MNRVFLQVGSRYPVNRKKIRTFVLGDLKALGQDDVMVNINIVGERKITELNEGFIGHEGMTDVLSFPQYDKGSEVDYESTLDPKPGESAPVPFITPPIKEKHLGDIVVCFPEVVRQAMKKGKMVDDHICFLIDHGLHHLLGMHHE